LETIENQGAKGNALRVLVCASVLLFVPRGVAREIPLNDWENPKISGSNNLAPHASMIVCPDTRTASKIDLTSARERAKSSFYRSLNGKWKYHYASNHLGRIPDFARTEFDDRSWGTIEVPSNVELSGHGTAVPGGFERPWKQDELTSGALIVCEDDPNNTVNSYRRAFSVPKDWTGRPVFLAFEGVSSFFYAWINGECVGFGKGSRGPMEFEITGFLKPGENLLAVETVRWCDGSYLEARDTWWLSGIFGDVYLWSTPGVHIRDFEVTADLDEQYRDADLSFKAECVNFTEISTEVSLRLELFEPDGKLILSPVMHQMVEGRSAATVEGVARVPTPLKWTAETPSLYRLMLSLEDGAGKTMEVIPAKIGFRKVEVGEGSLLVNGQRVLLKGVTWHRFDRDRGEAVEVETMERDVRLMKQFNINAVRCPESASDSRFYDLCDRYGIYVVDDAGINLFKTGATTRSPAFNADWSGACLSRTAGLVERDKNHPSIIGWSVGNGVAEGPNIESAAKWLYERDPGRPVQYAGAGQGWQQGAFSPTWMEESLAPPERRPSNFFQRLKWRDPKEKTVAAILRPDDELSGGIMTADRKPRARAYELKALYQPVRSSAIDLGARKIEIRNGFEFLNLSDVVVANWVLEADGKAIQRGAISDLDVAPGEARQFTLPINAFPIRPGAEYILRLAFGLKNSTSWARAGHEVASARFKLPDSMPAVPVASQAVQARR
jgi:beta-galactosidase